MNLERVSSWISVHNACNVKVVDKTSVAGIFFTTTLVMFCGRIALRTFGHQFEGRTSEIWPISKIMIMIIMHLFGSRSSNSRRESEDICHPIFIGQEILEFLKGKFKEGDKRFRFRSTSFLGPSHCRKNRQFFRHNRKHFVIPANRTRDLYLGSHLELKKIMSGKWLIFPTVPHLKTGKNKSGETLKILTHLLYYMPRHIISEFLSKLLAIFFYMRICDKVNRISSRE